MNEDAKKRLERLLQDLQEIEEASPMRVMCAVVSSSLESQVRSLATWLWVAGYVRERQKKDDPIIIDPNPIFVEPFQDGTGCLRWCGQETKREAFREWVIRLSGFFESNPDLVPDSESGYGVEGGLRSLCAIAAQVSEFSSQVKRGPILQLTGKRTLPPETPLQIRKMSPRPSFEVMEIKVPVPSFALMVLSHLLGKPTKRSRIEVKFDDSPAGQFANVIVDGKSHLVDKEFALIVQQLLKADGIPVSQPTMVANCPELQDFGRFSRIFQKKKNRVPFTIDSNTKGFFLPPEWL